MSNGRVRARMGKCEELTNKAAEKAAKKTNIAMPPWCVII
jgi:hypothetical protein